MKAAWELKGERPVVCQVSAGQWRERRTFRDREAFAQEGLAWARETARKAPDGVDATVPDWPAIMPAWPWPEDVSAGSEWAAFLVAWHRRHGPRPVPTTELARLRRDERLLPRLDGFESPPAILLAVALSGLAGRIWRGFVVARTDDGLFAVDRIPQDPTVRAAHPFTIRLSPEEHAFLEAERKALHVSRSAYVRLLIRLAMKGVVRVDVVRPELP